MRGDIIVAGAIGEDGSHPGVDGDRTNNDFTESGAVYLFARGASGWGQRAYIKASNPGTMDQFGVAMALGGDAAFNRGADRGRAGMGVNPPDQGDGAADSGAVYEFR